MIVLLWLLAELWPFMSVCWAMERCLMHDLDLLFGISDELILSGSDRWCV